MFVKLRTTIATTEGRYEAGTVYEVVDAIGASWIRSGLAEKTGLPPTFVSDFYAKMEEGAGKTCLFLPYLGEFGHMVMSHLRLVHWHKAARKIVCCRPGEEVLYPSADEFVTDWTHPIPDYRRVQTGVPQHWPVIEKWYPDAVPILSGGLTRTQQRLPIESGKRIPFKPKRRGWRVDVCIGTRFRMVGEERNWFHWQRVADALTGAGLTFAVIGVHPSSPNLIGQKHHSGDYDTDAAIELIRNCRLYLGSDSGNTHLACAVGADVQLIKGHAGDGYIPLMEQVNPGRVRLIRDGWDNPDEVALSAISRLMMRKAC